MAAGPSTAPQVAEKRVFQQPAIAQKTTVRENARNFGPPALRRPEKVAAKRERKNDNQINRRTDDISGLRTLRRRR